MPTFESILDASAFNSKHDDDITDSAEAFADVIIGDETSVLDASISVSAIIDETRVTEFVT